jgi:hypothetical protein
MCMQGAGSVSICCKNRHCSECKHFDEESYRGVGKNVCYEKKSLTDVLSNDIIDIQTISGKIAIAVRPNAIACELFEPKEERRFRER